jgi:hypothetical protein
MTVIIQAMPRAERGTGALMIAVEGHWNSRMAGSVGSFLPDLRQVDTTLLDDDALLMFRPFSTGRGRGLFASAHRAPPAPLSTGEAAARR